jgi:hypothetical protein
LAHTGSSTAPQPTGSGQPSVHAAFIVRVWRAADDARWRVHLIGRGERGNLIDWRAGLLTCDAVAAVGECIAARLPAAPRRIGLR